MYAGPLLHEPMPALRLPIDTARLRLRLPSEPDVEPWYRILSNPEVEELMAPEEPWTRPRVRAKVRLARRTARSGEAYELVVAVRASDEVVGRVALKQIVRGPERRATLAYWTARPSWGRGYTSEAVRGLIAAAYRDLALHRIDASVLAFNDRSMRLLESVGFRREGEKREAFLHRGRWISLHLYGLLAREFRRTPGGPRGSGPSRSAPTRSRPRRSGGVSRPHRDD